MPSETRRSDFAAGLPGRCKVYRGKVGCGRDLNGCDVHRSNCRCPGLPRVSEAFRTAPTQEGELVLSELHDVILGLPADERDAVVFVHMLGYQEESDDPEIVTAATRCDCALRTIRNRLTRAAAKLTPFKEALRIRFTQPARPDCGMRFTPWRLQRPCLTRRCLMIWCVAFRSSVANSPTMQSQSRSTPCGAIPPSRWRRPRSILW